MFWAFRKIHVLGYLWCYHDSLLFLEFSSLVITKEGNPDGISTMINLHTEHTRTPNRCQNKSQSSKSNDIPSGFLPLWWPKMKIQEKTMNHDNTKGIPIHESFWMPSTCGLTHPLLNYVGDHQCHGYCMILWCWGCPNGRTDPECPVHVDSPTPCLIILVPINPMNIMVPKVSWWMNVQYVWIHPPLD